MLESVAGPHALSTFPYCLLITCILHYYSIDLLGFLVDKVFTTFDSKTFAIIGYLLVGSEWCKKDSMKNKV